MRAFTTFAALLSAAAAQGMSTSGLSTITPNLNPTRAPSSIRDVESTATQSLAGPIQSGRACAQLADVVQKSKLQVLSVQAELALACLKSVPIAKGNASSTVDSLKQMVEFQSTLSYLKQPPKGWPNEPVDIMAGLGDIKSKVNDGGYTNEYDFENDIASLFVKAHDGHLTFNGMAYSGAFKWRRSSQIALISASSDGSKLPQVWAISDFNKTNASFQPSPVTRINDQDINQFLAKEAVLSSYHDPDTRYNTMFYMQPAESFGYFTNPRFYPGSTTNITYENGTTQNYVNTAVVVNPEAWSSIYDPRSFYDMFIQPSTSLEDLRRRDPNALPHHLEHPRELSVPDHYATQEASIPRAYPRPFVAHSQPTVPLAGYFINTAQGQIGVLVVQTFNTNDTAGAQEFQRIVQRYIAEAKGRGVAKHIIDVRTNGGGKVISGYDLYLQFFPSQDPQTQNRYRGHPASELFGKNISSFTSVSTLNAALFASPFSNDAYLDQKLEKFASWEAMYPPTRFYNDTFTALLKYNLSDPLLTTNERLGAGIVPTSYGTRSNFTEDPFRAEDLTILTDGICASTCSIFTELMVQQSNVKTIAVGGRPQLGPMVAVGGTKGTQVLPYTYLQGFSILVLAAFATTPQKKLDWAKFVPSTFSIAVQNAGVNFQDNIRVGLEKDGIPTQFLNDTASCRIWYEPQMYLNVTKLWEKTAEVAFGSNGGLDSGKCVAGSVSTREQQTGRGEANPASGDGRAQDGGDKDDAAVLLRPGWSVAFTCALVLGVGLSLI